jgi:SAM-dependent methyltransferase
VPHSSSVLDDLKILSEGLLRSVGKAALPGHVLEIGDAAAPLLNPKLLHLSGYDFSGLLKLNKGRELCSSQSLVCDTTRLPFQDGAFSKVLLNHVIGDGMETELEEAARVLTHDGTLIIVGLNRLGWRYRAQGRLRRLPGIAPLKVKSRLAQLDMSMQGYAGAGFFGLRRPEFMSTGLAGLGSPVADVVLLQARHRSGPEMTPLKFRRLGSGVVQSA